MSKKILISVFVLIGVFMFSSLGLAANNGAPGPQGPSDGGGSPSGGGVTISQICSENSMDNVTGIVNWASCFLYKVIVPFLFALATVAFIWGVIQYYLNPENEEKRKKGKSFIIGGLIALFVMLSIWGLVGILTGTFELSNTVPQLPGQ